MLFSLSFMLFIYLPLNIVFIYFFCRTETKVTIRISAYVTCLVQFYLKIYFGSTCLFVLVHANVEWFKYLQNFKFFIAVTFFFFKLATSVQVYCDSGHNSMECVREENICSFCVHFFAQLNILELFSDQNNKIKNKILSAIEAMVSLRANSL